MESDIAHQIDQAKRSLENSLKIIFELKDLHNDENFVDTYSGLVEDLLNTENDLKIHSTSFAQSRTAQTIADFDAAYSNGFILSQGRNDVKNSNQYKEMIQTAKDYFSIALGEDIAAVKTTLDDDLVIEENIPTVDPLTKGPLKNPVKNRLCGHIYGKNSMEQAIRSGNVRCPQMGCMNKKIITMKHLEEDHVLKMKLAAIQAKTRAEMEGIVSEEEE